MAIKARDVPRIRDQVVRSWEDGDIDSAGFNLQRVIAGDRWPPHARSTLGRVQWLDRAGAAAKDGEMWFVGEDMTNLIASSMDGIPPDTCLPWEMFPHPRGLMVVETSVTLAHAPSPVSVITWGTIIDEADGLESVEVFVYGFHPETDPQMIGWTVYRPDTPINRRKEPGEEDHASGPLLFLLATFALAASPGIADSTTEPLDRPARRRALRAGRDPDLAATRVIRLRTLHGDSDGDGEGHGYHHRWIVSGHWRSQPYGPGSILRKPVYIAPHVKGPDGAPLLTGEKVKALIR